MPQRWQKNKPGSKTEGGDGMAYATTDDIARARSMDLLTYLKNYEPGELVKVANGTYCTREHDSLKISNGMWYWFSRSIGGISALDYLIRVKGYSLPVAVETILGRAVSKPPVSYKQKDRTPKQLLLPEGNSTNANVTRYLRSRGIHPAILDYCYCNGLLYEGFPYRNAVFIGYDENRTPKYAALRGTVGNYKGEASGSDKQYSFNIPALGDAKTVHIFESAIDLLSYASMEYMDGRNWRREHLLSLAGVFKTERPDVVPVALQRFLKVHPEIHTLNLHLDADEIGRGAAVGIIIGLGDRYTVTDNPPKHGKDINDELRYQLAKAKGRENLTR